MIREMKAGRKRIQHPTIRSTVRGKRVTTLARIGMRPSVAPVSPSGHRRRWVFAEDKNQKIYREGWHQEVGQGSVEGRVHPELPRAGVHQGSKSKP